MDIRRTTLALLVAIAAVPAYAADDDAKPEYGAIEYRLVGPAIGGRTTRVSGVAGDPSTWYVANAQGGVWKSSDGGRSFAPIFDKEFSQSIGSLAVAPSDPNVVWVGGGEANIRGNVAIGWGVWRSTDAGRTWSHVLKLRGQIGTIAVDPREPDVALAAVLGSPFGPSEDRGVYRTTDGGATWKKVLYKDRDTGASDVAFDPNNPRIAFAGLWQTRRTPWSMTSGGPGSGLWRSTDGGATWKQLEGGGLPAEGPWGKVGVAVAKSDSDRVYALIEHAEGGLFRSDDGGSKWERVNGHKALRQRAWYYSTLVVDPTNADVVWFPQVPLLKSSDGGRTLARVSGPHHGDHHDLWIDPTDPKRMIDGNDGGVDLTTDGGATWWAPPLATGQFYNIDVDDRVPYHVGGTMQDWGTASGPVVAPYVGGATLGDWIYGGGGEAGDFVYDPAEAGHVYAGEYSGYISHHQEGTGQYRNIGIYPYNASGHGAAALEYRFQWTAPIADSPHDTKRLYHGGNVLFRSTDRGASWQAISPDLTRDDESKQTWSGGPITGDNTGVEVYGTIFSVAESPAEKGVIWTGSDDGLVHVSRDDGASWTNVTSKAWPEWATVEGIEPSRAAAGTAYVAVDAHRLDDFRPHAFVTRDYGAKWERITTGLPADMHVFVVREDPVDPDLLYLGGERGVFLSRDRGASWKKLDLNLPPVAVVDIEVRHDDLVLGTRGRAIWVLHDLAPVRGFDADVAKRDVHLFEPKPANRFHLGYRWDSESPGTIANPASGALLTYWLKKEPGPKDEITLDVVDASGAVVRTLSSTPKDPKYPKDDVDEPGGEPEPELSKSQGLNRATWDLRLEGAKRLMAKIDAGNPEQGPYALPGTYTLRLKANGETATTTVVVKRDPRSPVADAELAENHRFVLARRAELDRAADAIETVRAVRVQVSDVKQRSAARAGATALATAADAVLKRVDEIEGRLHNPKAEVVYDVLAQEGGAQYYSQISPLYSWAMSTDHAPTQGMRERAAALSKQLAQYEADVAALKANELAAFEREVVALGLLRVIIP